MRPTVVRTVPLILGLIGACSATLAPAIAGEEPRFALDLEAGPTWQGLQLRRFNAATASVVLRF